MANIGKHYSRPPITEAVLELRFEEPIDARDLERLRDRFKSRYAKVEEIQSIEVLFDAGGKVDQRVLPAGFKLFDKDAVDVLMLNAGALGTIRLAPYDTWDALKEKAKGNFEIFTKVLGRRKVSRIGTRFLNRIDIPNTMLEGTKLNDYFRSGIALAPEIGRVIGGFSLAVNTIHGETGAKLTIQSGIVAPALLDHTSISLDTDAYWDMDIPLRIEEMWARTDILRDAKNSVFENSITDKLRELFV